MSHTTNDEITQEIAEFIGEEAVYKDKEGYYINEWEDWELGRGGIVKVYLPSHLQEAAEILGLPYNDEAVSV